MIEQSWNYSNRKSRLVFAISVAYLSPGFILMNRTLVVVPTYNERENLPPLAQRILALPAAVDLLVVDDNSPDGTGKIANQLASEFPSIHVLHRTEKAGLGRAYIAGFTSDSSFLFQGEMPVIIFGDHTRCLKYVDFPFCTGADG